MHVSRQLRLEVERRELAAGTPITIRVRDSQGRPIENALVDTETKSARTDSRGLCQLRFDSPGFWKLTAAKAPTDRVAYNPVSTLVRVVPNEASLRPRRRIGTR
ncbi:carboxypeptidase-like regulatory domain-containing protein [Halosolutus halophilus]|uniref:carboxypeptidase-like regulatory domain-containing protein n=1 Tax=Halosolutus halophilus TaxID=1552990 RepID=UPI002234EF48|nr:carboxypeptidase-like regulatory domain-containing protein [Halosolutus halophilus]